MSDSIRSLSAITKLLLFSASLFLAIPAAAQEKQPQIVSNQDQGVFEIAYGNETLVRLAEKGEPTLNVGCCLHRNDETAPPHWIDPKNLIAIVARFGK